MINKKIKLILKITGFFLIILLVVFWLRSDFWLVKKIDCQIDDQDCPAEIWNKITDLSLRKNIIFFPRQLVKAKILEDYSEIDYLKIKKKLPQTLLFELKSRKPVIALGIELPIDQEATPSSEIKKPEFSLTGNFYLIDKKGVVVRKGNQSQNLPLILIKNDPNLKVGDQLSQEEIKKVMEILLEIRMHLLEPKIAKVGSLRKIEIWLKDETLVLMSAKKPIDSQLDSLQLIHSRAKIEGKQVKKIDLRFDKPVIVY